jgi:hypothetical protein
MEHNEKPTRAMIVPDAERLDFLPRHFGHMMLTVEVRVYSWLSTLSQDYTSGLWFYWTLENDGCYMTPVGPERLRIAVKGNDFVGTMSADAAGITAMLFALSELSFKHPRVEVLSTRFLQLREFAAEHAECRLIFQAID